MTFDINQRYRKKYLLFCFYLPFFRELKVEHMLLPRNKIVVTQNRAFSGEANEVVNVPFVNLVKVSV